MSINLPNHYTMQFATNISLLLQQQGSKLRGTVTEGTYTGEQASPVDQIGSVEMQEVTTRFAPMGRVDAPVDRRWVFPSSFDLPQLVDTLDQLKMVLDPKSALVQNAVLAAGRQIDKLVLAAVTGTAKTGKQGGTSTIFTAANEVDVSVGGTNSALNVSKLRAAKKGLMANHVDFDREPVYVGLTAVDHDALLNEIQIISSDFSGNDKPVLMEGKVQKFLGFQFVHCELIETVMAGTNEVTLPVWAKSGMHLGIWSDIRTDLDQRKDLQNMPFQAYVAMTMGATRIEEKKVFAIESYRA